MCTRTTTTYIEVRHSDFTLLSSRTQTLLIFLDYLLCHDDQLEGRRFAYILYLTPDWEESDGGSLQLFNSKETLSITSKGMFYRYTG